MKKEKISDFKYHCKGMKISFILIDSETVFFSPSFFWSDWHKLKSKFTCIDIGIRKLTHNSRKKNYRFIYCASSWNRAVCFIDFHLYSVFVACKCHVIDFRSIRLVNQSALCAACTNAKYSRIRHVFVYWDFLLACTFGISGSSERVAAAGKKAYKQKQCIENGSLWRVFNGLISIVYTFTDFYDLDSHTRCKSIKMLGVFSTFIIISIIIKHRSHTRQALVVTMMPHHMHTRYRIN